MRNVKAWRVEAGTDDQILSLSGCPVTEVYSEELCGKRTGFLRRTCAVRTTRPNEEFLAPPTYSPLTGFKKKKKKITMGRNIQYSDLSKRSPLLHIHKAQSRSLLNSMKILQVDKKFSKRLFLWRPVSLKLPLYSLYNTMLLSKFSATSPASGSESKYTNTADACI